MKPMKFWAHTKEDSENFFNYLRVNNIKDNLEWAYAGNIVKGLDNTGWFLDEDTYVTYAKDKEYFDEYEYKEFFFPIPVEEFVETLEVDTNVSLSETCDVISDKHKHYYKDVSHLDYIDVYRTLFLFNVTDPCLQHSIKKLLVAGGRGAGKDVSTDIQEAIDSLERWKEMKEEDNEK